MSTAASAHALQAARPGRQVQQVHPAPALAGRDRRRRRRRPRRRRRRWRQRTAVCNPGPDYDDDLLSNASRHSSARPLPRRHRQRPVEDGYEYQVGHRPEPSTGRALPGQAALPEPARPVRRQPPTVTSTTTATASCSRSTGLALHGQRRRRGSSRRRSALSRRSATATARSTAARATPAASRLACSAYRLPARAQPFPATYNLHGDRSGATTSVTPTPTGWRTWSRLRAAAADEWWPGFSARRRDRAQGSRSVPRRLRPQQRRARSTSGRSHDLDPPTWTSTATAARRRGRPGQRRLSNITRAVRGRRTTSTATAPPGNPAWCGQLAGPDPVASTAAAIAPGRQRRSTRARPIPDSRTLPATYIPFG